MRILAALLIALPLAAAAQGAPPPEVPPAAQAAPPAQPSPPAPAAPAAQPAQPSPPPAAPLAYGPAFQRRDAWYVGFGLGGGAGRLKDDSGSYGFSDGLTDPITVFINFKVGATLTPRLLVGFDISALRTGGTISGFDAAIQVSNYDAMLTWFPMERGLFLRGGLGVSRITAEVSGLGSSGFNGVNATVGGGYAFWLGRTFNLTLNVDFSAQSYSSSTGPSTSHYTALWLGFDWY